MNFNNISFPHPVLGVANEVSSEIKRIEKDDISINPKSHSYEIRVKLSFDDEVLRQLIQDDKAEFICEATCSNTLYRKIIRSEKPKIEFEILRKQVKGRIDFLCLLVAKENIESYSNTNFHSDYNGFSFEVEQGEVLAYFGDFYFNADIKYEKLKAVSSFMEIVPNEELTYTYVDLKKSKMTIYYKDATVKSEIVYVGSEALKWEEYYPNATLEFVEEYNKSFEYYVFKANYFENGTPENTLELTDKKKLVYTQTYYHANGQIKEQGEMFYNKNVFDYERIGSWKTFDENGSPKKETKYVNGKVHSEKNL